MWRAVPTWLGVVLALLPAADPHLAAPRVVSVPVGRRTVLAGPGAVERGVEGALPTPIRRRRPTSGRGDDGAAGRRALQASHSPHPGSFRVRASEANGYAYYATLHFGNPPIAIGVDLDTGSSSLAVPSSFCENCAVDIETYNPGSSTSSNTMSCDDITHCDNSALLWSPDCVSDTSSESSPDIGDEVLRAWKTHDPGWVAPTYRRVRLLFDHGSCAVAASISGVFTLDDAKPTIAGQPHYTQEVCVEDKTNIGAGDNCTTYHLQYSEEFAESNWPWVIALRASADTDAGEASDDSDIQHLARFAADMDLVRAGLTLGEAVPAQCLPQAHQTLAQQYQASSLAVRAYKPFGPPTCCAQHSHACLHSDYYSDGSGTTGPVYRDKVRLGAEGVGLSTHAYFKAFEDDEGGVASGGHFASSHSTGAGIWGLAPADRQQSKSSGVRLMGSVLSALLADNDLADAFALCFDDSPAAISAGDGEAASSIDLGGPDPRKYRGSMQFLQMLTSDSYSIQPPQHMFVGDNMDAAMDAVASAAEGVLKRVVIDSGTALTLSLPREIERGLAATVLAWFRSEYDLSDGAAATAANVAQQLFAEGSSGCISFTAHAARTVSLFPTLDLVFADVRGESMHIRLPPASYLDIWPEEYALCLLIDGKADDSTGTLAAGFLRRYYTLFDRQRSRIGVADRADCTPDESPTATDTAASRCAARANGGCSTCAGPIDDLELDRGYCIWCPSTATCSAYDPRSLSAPCSDAQGYDHPTLDATPGGPCPEFTYLERTCQAAYNQVTDLAMRGNVAGECSAAAQHAINSFAAACQATTVRLHQRGKTADLPGAACVLAVLAGSTSVHGMDECTIPNAIDSCRGADHVGGCAYDNDGECDAGSYCPDGSDLMDCYGTSTTTTCPANSHASSVGCVCDSGFEINDHRSGCNPTSLEPDDGEASEGGESDGDSCWSANDGECDSNCPPGTDTADCDPIGGATNEVPSSVDCPAGWIYDPELKSCDNVVSSANTCPTAGDGVCDEPQRCPLGSDQVDCRPGQIGVCPPHSHVTAGHTCTCEDGFISANGFCVADDADCSSSVERVNDGCPSPEQGFITPSSCPAACQRVFVTWWSRCAHDDAVVASLGNDGMAQLRAFYHRCLLQGH